MSRKKRSPAKKKKGGLLIGLRGGVQRAARAVSGGEEKKKEKGSPWKGWNLVWNVVTGALVVVAGAMLLRNCGVISF